MASYSRQLLSGSTNGKAIPVVATSTPGTTIHTALSGTSGYDEVWVWAANVTSSSATLTIEWGGTGTGNHSVDTVPIPANSLALLIIPGTVLQNSLVVGAYSNSANAINITGYVNRIQ